MPGQIYNVAGGSQATINQVVDALGILLDREIAVAYGAPAPGDVRNTHASVEKARRDLGYQPKVSLAEGLGRQVEWQRAEQLGMRDPPATPRAAERPRA